MASTLKYICRCGSHVEELTSYSNDKGTITVCDGCAETYNLRGVHPITKEKLFTEQEYSNIKVGHNKS